MPQPLGRRTPTDWRHVERYLLTDRTLPSKPVPVALGCNWYKNFDNPVRDNQGRYWVGRTLNLGQVRGGHCVCIPPDTLTDTMGWWDFYDQGREGACVGFGSSRMMSLLNRKRYDARWLWNQAKQIDEWPDTNPGDDNGTSVRAGMDVLRLQGHVPNGTTTPNQAEGIAANRWATHVQEILAALQSKYTTAVPLLNSWGRSYPHKVWLPLDVLQRLLDEYGEATMVTDR